MNEEYTGPRRCDLCHFDDEDKCPDGPCHSGNGLKNFKPKGERPEQQDGIKDLLDLKLNGELQFAHGRYIRVPGGWVFESGRIRSVAACFIPEPK